MRKCWQYYVVKELGVGSSWTKDRIKLNYFRANKSTIQLSKTEYTFWAEDTTIDQRAAEITSFICATYFIVCLSKTQNHLSLNVKYTDLFTRTKCKLWIILRTFCIYETNADNHYKSIDIKWRQIVSAVQCNSDK